jgi:hypothetical protein
MIVLASVKIARNTAEPKLVLYSNKSFKLLKDDGTVDYKNTIFKENIVNCMVIKNNNVEELKAEDFMRWVHQEGLD